MEIGTRCRFPEMAKKAKIMNNDIFTHSLVLPSFAIDFDVKKNSSLEWTRKFDSHGSDFVFAVADTWLRLGVPRYPLVSEFHTGNLIELLKSLEKSLRNPISIQGIEKIIFRGGWGKWMSGYWNRLNNDFDTSEDEAIYDQLIQSSLMEGRQGHVAAYRYEGIPIIEAATRPASTEDAPIYVWAEFDPEKIANEVLELQKAVSRLILTAA